MISFWVDEAHDFGIRNYLEGRGRAVREQFTVQYYERLAQTIEVSAGPQIFSGLDQLGPAGRLAVGEIYDQLGRLQPGVPLLNDPRRCLLRPALLKLLADRGLNSFRAYDVADAEQVIRFPVFVREAHRHDGSLTRLLGSQAELRRALTSLRIRGYRQAQLLIIEYCDTSDRKGIFRKYAAFKVGDAIVPAHMIAGRRWELRSEACERSLEFIQEDLGYIEENPHQDWLRVVFDLAGIDYGRIDYGMSREGPQAWEVNLNPTMGRGVSQSRRRMTPEAAAIFDRAREASHSQVRSALVALDPEAGNGRLSLRLEPSLLAEMARESARGRHRSTTLSLLHRLYRSPMGSPFRFLLGQLFPLG